VTLTQPTKEATIDKEGSLTPNAQDAIGEAARANVDAAVEVAKSAVSSFVDVLTARGRSLNVGRGAQPGRRPRLAELRASGRSRIVPLAPEDPPRRHVVEAQENPQPSGDLAQAERVPPRLANPHARPLLANGQEGLLKPSEAKRNLAELSLGGPVVVARVEQTKKEGLSSKPLLVSELT